MIYNLVNQLKFWLRKNSSFLRLCDIYNLITIAIVTFSLFIFSGCEDNKSNIDKIVVGTSADNPPYEYIGQDGKIVGIDIDIAKTIAKKLNKDLEIKNIDFNGLIPSLRAGHIDFAIACIEKTEDRDKIVDFSIPYLSSPSALVFLKGKIEENLINSDQKEVSNVLKKIIKDKKVGAQLGSTGSQYIEKFKNSVNFELKNMASNVALVQELKNGNIDFVILEKNQVNNLGDGSDFGYILISESQGMRIALPKNSDLTPKINEILKAITEDGTINEIEKRYLGK